MSSSVFVNRCRVLMAKAKTATSSTASTKKPSGILKMQTVSPALAKFIGSPQASRSESVKKIWDYIKSNNLQNPANKKEIFCDDKLKTIFDGKDTVDFGGVAKMLSNHFPKAA